MAAAAAHPEVIELSSGDDSSLPSSPQNSLEVLRAIVGTAVDEATLRTALNAAGGDVNLAASFILSEFGSGSPLARPVHGDTESEDEFPPGSEEPCAPRRRSPRLPPQRYHRLAADVNLDEEAELRRLEGRGSAQATGGSFGRAAGGS